MLHCVVVGVAFHLAEKMMAQIFSFVSVCNRRRRVNTCAFLFRIDAFAFQEDCRHAASEKNRRAFIGRERMMHIAHAVSPAMLAPFGASAQTADQAGVHCGVHYELGSARDAKNTNSGHAGSIVKNLGG
jgi:hypothetical protein